MRAKSEVEEEYMPDIWACLKCGRTVTAPKVRCWNPNTICKHNELTEEEVWYDMVKIN